MVVAVIGGSVVVVGVLWWLLVYCGGSLLVVGCWLLVGPNRHFLIILIIEEAMQFTFKGVAIQVKMWRLIWHPSRLAFCGKSGWGLARIGVGEVECGLYSNDGGVLGITLQGFSLSIHGHIWWENHMQQLSGWGHLALKFLKWDEEWAKFPLLEGL